MNTNLMFSSETDLWATPQGFFDELNEEFHFTLDVCANESNHKVDRYFTREDDAIQQDWSGDVCWMNPPYGLEIAKFIKKAHESKTTVVALLPARTDTKWFHDHIYGFAEIRFIKGRLRFGGHKNPAPFPSMVVIWR